MKHLTTIDELNPQELLDILQLADELKTRPADYEMAMHRKVLLMMFEKPSLRTRLSFEAGMSQMGGHAIYYDTATSPLGAGKETVHDTIRVASRFVDLVMARLLKHGMIEELARYAQVPVINALTDQAHPCQILADFQTIREKKGALQGVTLAYYGDAENNVTYSLMLGCAMAGINLVVACPDDEAFRPNAAMMERARELAATSGAGLQVVHDALAAARGADVLYTDSWMSYHIPREETEARVAALRPYQINAEVMAQAHPDAIFMNCLPALRGYEQSEDVIDGPQSVVFDQAENRLHAQKAVMLKLLEWSKATT